KPIQVKIEGWCGPENKTLLMDQTMEIASGVQKARIFSVVAPRGNTCLAIKGPEGTLEQTVSATLMIQTDY
ncbi:MAG: hypothetical protein PHV34_24220, partial [Verrucomicrobiae bacterium]|nr:hypothetical protein [Verrucomicrobiae bacterium]